MQLENFAQKVAERAGVVPKLEAGMVGAVDIIAIIEAIGAIIEKLLANCPNKPALAKAAANPTFLQKVRLRRLVSDDCDCCGVEQLRRNRGKVADAILDIAAATPQADLQAMVDAVDYDVL